MKIMKIMEIMKIMIIYLLIKIKILKLILKMILIMKNTNHLKDIYILNIQYLSEIHWKKDFIFLFLLIILDFRKYAKILIMKLF